MGALTVMPAVAPVVEPGGQTSVEITVRNTGSVVDSFTVEPLGVPAEWTVVEPPSVHLLPGTEAPVQLTFRPPQHFSTPTGLVPWAVQVRSSEDPDGSIVDEGVIEVGSFSDVRLELTPRTSHARGRRAGRHKLAVDNCGNEPAHVRLSGVDEAEKLGFSFGSVELLLEPGAAQIVPLKVRATKRFWRGQPVTHPFTVVADPVRESNLVVDEDGELVDTSLEEQPAELVSADGALLQDTVVPAWLLKALLLAAVLLSLLAALWATVLKPTIEDVAQAQAEETAEQVAAEEAAAAADKAVAPVKQSVDDLAKKVTGEPVPDPTPTPTTPTETDGTPLSVRLAATTTQQSPSAVLDEEHAVRITDLLLQNPQGDSGTVAVLQDGKVVYVARLDNFRDLDLHLVAPVTLAADKAVTFKVTCENAAVAPAGSPPKPCTPAVTVNGFAQDVTPQPTPSP